MYGLRNLPFKASFSFHHVSLLSGLRKKSYSFFFSTQSHTSNVLNWILFTLPNKILLTFYTFITKYFFLLNTFYDP